MYNLKLLILTAFLACGPAHTRNGSPPDESESRTAAAADTSVVALLRSRGFRLDSVVAERGPYVAVLARRDADSSLHLVALRRTRASPTVLGRPDPMMEGYPPESVRWLSLGGSETDALLYTHNIPSEGVIGTVVYTLLPDTMVLTFEPGADECRPGEVRDVDGDGRPELLAFTEDPSRGYCGSECHIEITEVFGAGPHWVDVYRWNGTGWIRENRAFPAFYARLGRQYRAIQEWLDGNGEGRSSQCKTPSWIRNKPVFRQWAERADSIASHKGASK